MKELYMDLRKNFTIEQKLEIMEEFVRETGEEIKSNTVYRKLNIGIWKNNIRSQDNRGELNISPELRERLKKIGVIGERKRSVPISDEQIYNMLIDFHKVNPSQRIEKNTVDSHGSKIGIHKGWLQHRYNCGEIRLSDEQIKDLRGLGYLRLSPKEHEEINRKYGIDKVVAKRIFEKYGDIDQFVEGYKTGKIKIDPEERARLGIREPGVVTICSREISLKQKEGYVKLALKLLELREASSVPYTEIQSIDIDVLDKELKRLSIRQETVLRKRYGLDDGNVTTLSGIATEYGVRQTRIEQIQKKAEERLAKQGAIERVAYDSTYGDEAQRLLTSKMKELECERDKIQEVYNARKKDIAKSNVNSADGIIPITMTIGQMRFSTRTHNILFNNGITTAKQLCNLTENQLRRFKGMGTAGINEIKERLLIAQQVIKDEMSPMEILEELQEYDAKIFELYRKIEAHKGKHQEEFDIACQNLLDENIFDPNQIIQPSRGRLAQLRLEKEDKMREQDRLDLEIQVQNDLDAKLSKLISENQPRIDTQK